MNWKLAGQITGASLLGSAAAMILPLIFAAISGEQISVFLIPVLGCALLGGLLFRRGRGEVVITAREGLLSIGLCWLILSLSGALPLLLTGQIAPIDAVFEIIYGYTTTGATILPEVEALPRSLLLWRALTQGIGGVGFVVFMIMLIPASQGSTMNLAEAEASPAAEKLFPRFRQSAAVLCGVYGALILVETLLLRLAGMPLWESLCHALATAGTGGFSTRTLGVAAFHSPAIESIIAIFMLIFGVNLKLVWLFVTGRTAQALKNEEFRWYAGLFLLFWLMIAGSLILDGKALVHALGLAFFQTASAVSTTGFASADFNRWPPLCRLLLPLITMFGACTGSSGGGLKIGRVLLAGKTMKRELHRSRQPQIVKTITLDQRPVSEVTIQRTLTFILIYLSFFLCGWILLAACGLDLETSGSAVLTCMNNSGTGLNAVGPLGSYAAFSPFAKLTLCLVMLAGRLEFYPLILVCLPKTWTAPALKMKSGKHGS